MINKKVVTDLNFSMQSIPLGSSLEYTKQLKAALNSSPHGPYAMPPRQGQSQLISPVSGLKAPSVPACDSRSLNPPASPSPGCSGCSGCTSTESCCCCCGWAAAGLFLSSRTSKVEGLVDSSSCERREKVGCSANTLEVL